MADAEDALVAVVSRAVRDKAFFHDLLGDVDGTLARHGLRLSAEQVAQLKDVLSNPSTEVKVDLRTFIEAVHERGGLGEFEHWLGFHWLGAQRPRGE